MLICHSIAECQAARDTLAGEVALVPTMGNLHEGHLSLVKHAKNSADHIIVSIFVNPMQFGANEDLDSYPRTMADDQAKLRDLDIDILFIPTVDLVYPDGVNNHTQVQVPNLTDSYCGANRPGHFTGVATIVLKLLTISLPDIAIFGKKDFQQLAVIRKLANDMALPTQIIGLETSRSETGLALSSRNQYLSTEERHIASQLYSSLSKTKAAIIEGNTNFTELCEKAVHHLEQQGFQMEYFSVADQHTLLAATEDTHEIVILAAGRLGTTRLIDNIDFVVTN